MTDLDHIRSRVSIEEVVASYVQLKKSGRNLKGLCPFHKEKTPSFIVSPDKGLAYCFGCRKGGDIFSFLQEVEQIDFSEALKILADKAGVTLQKTHSDASKHEREIIRELLQEALGFFQEALQKNPETLRYLEHRGFSSESIRQFQLGYAKDSFHELTTFLERRGFTKKNILESGLAAQKEIGDDHVYDRFRHRIMFPIHDAFGSLVAFGGRTLSDDPDTPKYINAPETKLYHKGKMLYLFHLAKNAIREKGRVIITEGYFDALTAHLHGFHETVASLGTALTEEQIRLLARSTAAVMFAFDADSSGQSAASRSIEVAQTLGLSPKMIRIPSGKDPDEAIRSDPQEWEKALTEASSALEYEFLKSFSGVNPKTLEGKKLVLERFFPVLHRLPSFIDQEFYLKKLSSALETSFESLFTEFRRIHRPLQSMRPESAAESSPVSFSRFEHLAGILLRNPELRDSVQKDLKEAFLTDEEKSLYKQIVNAYNSPEPLLKEHASTASTGSAAQLLQLFAENTYAHFSDVQLAEEVEQLLSALREQYKKRRLHELRAAILQKPDDGLLKTYHDILADRF